jgi:hypothetical protein
MVLVLQLRWRSAKKSFKEATFQILHTLIMTLQHDDNIANIQHNSRIISSFDEQS